jgi:hypothetical protein
MRFEISYTGGTTHEVELPGPVCVVGRDPGCDIVLNDSKCSRRHAVVEQGADGIVVRDSASANGIYVNGRKVEKAALRPGDVVRLGEVKLRLLAEIGETVVMAPEGLELDAPGGPGGPTALGDTGPQPVPTPVFAQTPLASPPVPVLIPIPAPPAPAPRAPQARPPARPQRAEPARRVGSAASRPATVSLLAVLWAAFVPAAVAGALWAAARVQAGWPGWIAAGALAVVAAGLGTAMAVGLRGMAPWARHLQIATAAVGLLICPFTLAAATVLLYMSRPEVRTAFEGTPGSRASGDSAEPTFALSLVGMLLLGLALTAIVALLF